MPNSDESRHQTIHIKLPEQLTVDMKKVDVLNSDSISTSRYGRQRKPKITEDFYCTDDVIAPLINLNKSNTPNKYYSRQTESKTDMKNLRYTVKFKKTVPNLYLNTSQPESETDRNNRVSVDINTSDSELDKDYNEVLKIVSRCNTTVTSPNTPKTPLKTYSNRRKYSSVCNALTFTDDAISRINTYSWIESVPDILQPLENDDDKNISKKSESDEATDDKKSDLNEITVEKSETPKLEINDIKKENEDSGNKNLDTSKINETDPCLVILKNKFLRECVDHNIGLKIIEDFASDTNSQDSLSLHAFTNFDNDTSAKMENSLEGNDNSKTDCKDDVSIWKVGDLVWARIGKHPFWPCLIMLDPILNIFRKTQGKGRDGKLVENIHVRFFGDSGRRAWVSVQFMIPFLGKENFDQLAQNITADVKRKEPKYAAGFVVTPQRMTKWVKALTEATSLLSSTIEERFNFFKDMFEVQTYKESSEKRKNLKRKLPLSEMSNNLKVKQKKHKDLKSNILKSPKENYENMLEKNSSAEEKMLINDNKEKPECLVSDKPVVEINKPETRKSKAAALNSENSIKTDQLDVKDFNIPLLENKNSVRRKKPNFTETKIVNCLKRNWEDISEKGTVKKEPLEPKTNSKNDMKTISSVIRHKRNNLFRGMTKQRVCQCCEKTGNVIRCKGPCLTFYHIQCVKNLNNVYLKELCEMKENTIHDCDLSLESKNVNTESNIASFSVGNIDNTNSKSLSEIENSEEKHQISEEKHQNNEEKRENIEEKHESIEEKHETIEEKHESIEEKHESIEEKHVNIEEKHENIEEKHENIEENHENVEEKHENIEEKNEILEEKHVTIEEKHKNIEEKYENVEEKAKNIEEKHENIEEKNESNINSDKQTVYIEISSANNDKIVDISENICSDFSNNPVMSVENQIDAKMKEVMGQLSKINKYTETTTEESSSESEMNSSCTSKNKVDISFPVLGDVVSGTVNKSKKESTKDTEDFLCNDCNDGRIPSCFICLRYIHRESKSDDRQKCMVSHCGKFYHVECLELWPQTHWITGAPSRNLKKLDKSYKSFTCPNHVCHTCMSDNPHGVKLRFHNEKLAKCIRCPTSYHANNFCVPAGSVILTMNQIICPKHVGRLEKTKKIGKLISMQHVNASWCFICAIGGSLICCETCPTSFHAECLRISPPEGSFICEDCETGRFPLYNEIVWVKLGNYRWWPAQILFPNEVPSRIKSIPHNDGEFVVRFFGSHDHYWVNRGRVFLYQEGDTGGRYPKKSNVDELFLKAVAEAAVAYSIYKDERENREAEVRNDMKPPPYIRIKSNKPVGNVRVVETHASSMTTCECDPKRCDPCGPDSDCLNRILLTECNPQVCPAGERCGNQAFEKRIYPELTPFRTAGRGWGLKTLVPLTKAQFVIEYVGEMIDDEEYQRRLQRMNEQKDENYYFLTIEKDRILDAGPKGNVARFMNHSCQPNCETQKWTVNGDTRVGLFALADIPTNTELTFNYNLECVGKAKKQCKCGSVLCSGFIGAKAKQEEIPKKDKKIHRLKNKKNHSKHTKYKKCFICGEDKSEVRCNIKYCSKDYHFSCVNLELLPEGKWLCPRHRCKVCHKRKAKFCNKCTSAYCEKHAGRNLIYSGDKILCKIHRKALNITLKNNSPQKKIAKEQDTSSTNSNNQSQNNNLIKKNCKTKDIIDLSNEVSITDLQLQHKSRDSTPSSLSSDLFDGFSNELESSDKKNGGLKIIEIINNNFKPVQKLLQSVNLNNSVANNSCIVPRRKRGRPSKNIQSEVIKNDSVPHEIILNNAIDNERILKTELDTCNTVICMPTSEKRKKGRPRTSKKLQINVLDSKEVKQVKNGFIENHNKSVCIDLNSSTSLNISKCEDINLSETCELVLNNSVDTCNEQNQLLNKVLECQELNIVVSENSSDNRSLIDKLIKLDKNLPIRKRTGLRSLSLAHSN